MCRFYFTLYIAVQIKSHLFGCSRRASTNRHERDCYAAAYVSVLLVYQLMNKKAPSSKGQKSVYSSGVEAEEEPEEGKRTEAWGSTSQRTKMQVVAVKRGEYAMAKVKQILKQMFVGGREDRG